MKTLIKKRVIKKSIIYLSQQELAYDTNYKYCCPLVFFSKITGKYNVIMYYYNDRETVYQLALLANYKIM